MLPRLFAAWAFLALGALAHPTGRQDPLSEEVDSDESRRVLGSSVVTSVSVIMDLGHGGGAALLSESPGHDSAAGQRPNDSSPSSQERPVGSPPALMSPDRYEFYTFDESGELVRRLMTLEQIQSLIAGGGEAQRLSELAAIDVEDSNSPPSTIEGDPQVEVVANVQQVLAGELLASIRKNNTEPQEGEVEVEAVVQEVAPPTPSEHGGVPHPANATDDGHGVSTLGEDDAGGETTEEDISAQVEDGHESTPPSHSIGENTVAGSNESSETSLTQLEEDGEDHSKGPGSPQDISSEAPSIDVTPSPTSSIGDSTVLYADDTTTVTHATGSLATTGQVDIHLTEHPEIPLKHNLTTDKLNISAPTVTIEYEEGDKPITEGVAVDHSQGDDFQGEVTGDELINKNPPSLFQSGTATPTPEFNTVPVSKRPSDSGIVTQDEPLDTNMHGTHEILDSSTSSEFIPELDEIPSSSDITDFQPPEEADLSAYFDESSQNLNGDMGEKGTDIPTTNGPSGSFSDKNSFPTTPSDLLNLSVGLHTMTPSTEHVSVEGFSDEMNEGGIQEPSASLLPPLLSEEQETATVPGGLFNSGSTENTDIKDENTAANDSSEEDDNSLLDELAESVSNVLSQVSDLVDDSEEITSKKPALPVETLASTTPTEVSANEETQDNLLLDEKYNEKDSIFVATTPGPSSDKENHTQETSTHVVNGNNGEVGEVSTALQGEDDNESPQLEVNVHSSTTKIPMSTTTFSYDSASESGMTSVTSVSERTTENYESFSLSSETPSEFPVELADIVDSLKISSAGTTHRVTIRPEVPTEPSKAAENDNKYIVSTLLPEEGTIISLVPTAESATPLGETSTEMPGTEKTTGETYHGKNPDDAYSSTENANMGDKTESSNAGLNAEAGSTEITSTTHPLESESGEVWTIGGVIKPDHDVGNKETGESETTTKSHSEEVSLMMIDKVSEEMLKPVILPVTSEPEHLTVNSVSPTKNSVLGESDDNDLLDQLHKAAEAQSDPLLSAHDEDDGDESYTSTLKDEYEKPTRIPEESDGIKETLEEGVKSPVSSEQGDSVHSLSTGKPEETEPLSTTNVASPEELLPSPTQFADAEEFQGTVKPITTPEDADESVSSFAEEPVDMSTKFPPPLSHLNTAPSAEPIKPTTYRPVYIPLATPSADHINAAYVSASPDDLPDPNGLSSLLNEKEPALQSPDASSRPVTEMPPAATTPGNAGVSGVVPPLMPSFPPAPPGNVGLEATSSSIDPDVKLFVDLCNDLAFALYSQVTSAQQSVPNTRGTHSSPVQTRSLVLSPFAISSMLAMVFLGARGTTSEQMNDLLHLDDVVTFNPHLVLQNVTESVITSPGVSAAAFVRELYSDKKSGHLLEFYKARAKAFYEGHVEEVDFRDVNDVIRRRTNHLVRWQTRGRVPEYLRGSSLRLRPPLAALSANFFEADCQRASSLGADGEMYFEIPATGRRRRRLVPIPAVIWRGVFLAGYDPGLDATALELRHGGGEVSTVLVLPGRHGQSIPTTDDDVGPSGGLSRLEAWLSRGGKDSWGSLLRSAVPRGPIEVQLPRFAHRSVLNVTGALARMGLQDLFTSGKADLRGLDGGLAGRLHLSDAIQMTAFGVCAEDGNSRRHLETYPSAQRTGREGFEEWKEMEEMEEKEEDSVFAAAEAAMVLPLELRPRQARVPRPQSGVVLPRLRFDRPFLYYVRHNPSGFILLMGRFNPRLFP